MPSSDTSLTARFTNAGIPYQMSVDIAAAIALGSGGASSTVALAGTTLTLSSANTSTYNGNVISAQSASATTITLNTGAALTAGFAVIQKGAGIVTLNGTATLTSPNGLSTSGADTMLTIVPTGTDAYDVFASPTADKTFVNAAAGATPAVDMAKYNVVDLTLTANCTPAFSGSVSGQAFSVTLILRTGAGSFTFTPPTTKWNGGAPFVISSAAAKIDIITLTTLDGGTSYFGFIGGQAFA
jgi:hypothetical protein